MVRAVSADVEVHQPVEADGAQLHPRVRGDVAGQQPLHDAGLAAQPLQRLVRAGIRAAAAAHLALQLGHRAGERVLERVDHAVVGRDARLLQQVGRDLEVGAPRERDQPCGRRAGDALERDQERVAAELRRVDQRAVDVPQDECAQIQAADSRIPRRGCPSSRRLRRDPSGIPQQVRVRSRARRHRARPAPVHLDELSGGLRLHRGGDGRGRRPARRAGAGRATRRSRAAASACGRSASST